VKSLLHKAPKSLAGMIESMAGRVEDSVKHLLVPGMIFQELGFRYIGPIDGHDLNSLIDTFEGVRAMHGPILVHVLTRKGKGFAHAVETATSHNSSFDGLPGASSASHQ
jgi:1-deoxy-D-xylulose-5-phosphate synthase